MQDNEHQALKDCHAKLDNANALQWKDGDPCNSAAAGNLDGTAWGVGSSKLQCKVVNGTTRVVKLLMNGLGVEGVLCSEFGRFRALTELDVSSNSLSGYLPNALRLASNLEKLSIKSNSLSGSIPDDWVDLTKLNSFALDYNPHLCGTEWLGAIRLPEDKIGGSVALYQAVLTGGGYNNTYVGTDCDDLLESTEIGSVQVIWSLALIPVGVVLSRWALQA